MKDSKGFGTLISISSGWAHIVGVDAGPNVTLEAQSKECIVLKIGGHNYFASRGQQTYAPAVRAVFQIEKDLGNGRYRVRPLVEYPIRRK